MTAWPHRWARAYGWGLKLLPLQAKRYEKDMVVALEDQLRITSSRWSAAAMLLRAFGRLPLVLLVEWKDAIAGSRSSFYGGSRGVFLPNVRLAARSLRKSPTFTWVSVLLIGLGVGAVTAVFTVVDHVLLRPLPYPEQERLTFLSRGAHNGPTLRALRDVDAFDTWMVSRVDVANLTRVGAEPMRLTTAEVSPSFFTLFGARPSLGRVLVDDDAADLAVAVLAYDAWTSIWASDPSVVGSTILLDAEPVTVVGVLDAGFVMPTRPIGRGAQVFRPMDWNNPRLAGPGFQAHQVTARLAQGVDLAAAQAQIDRVFASLREQELLRTNRADPWPLVPLKDMTVRGARQGLMLLLGSVALLLLVACANVALLFMARGISRVREMSVRRALGAGTRTLLGQLATESLLVGVAGGLVGVLLARLSLIGFDQWIDDLPRAEGIVLDTRVLMFTIALSLVTALLFGLAPALRSLGDDLNSQLREGGRGSSEGRGVKWVRGGLIVGEVGGSLVLVAVAGLLLKSFLAMTSRDPGIEPDGVWVVALNTPELEGDDAAQLYRQHMYAVLAAVEDIPGVTSAAYGIEMPFEWVGGNTCCWSQLTGARDAVELTPGEGTVVAYLHPVTVDFFETLGTRIVAGTTWTATDVEIDPYPVVLNEALAIWHFGSASAAVGQELRFDDGRVRVIGVAEQTAHYGLDQRQAEAMYLPMERLDFGNDRVTFAVKAPGVPSDIADAIREAIWSAEPNIPVPSVVRMQTWIDDSSGMRRFGSAMASAFGAIALLLAAGGLYGTLLYAASQRRRELGIRIALGANRSRIEREVIGGGVGLALAGLALGVPVAIALGRLLESFVWEVSVRDPMTLGVASTVLVGTAALASWLPAYRAARTDPLEVLKAE